MKLIIDEIKYRQPPDAHAEWDQEITVQFIDCGGGYFYRLKTDGWNMDTDDAPAFLQKLQRICSENDKAMETWEP